MTSKIDDGGPAFPKMQSFLKRDNQRERDRFTYDVSGDDGMSLRDWFAGNMIPGEIDFPSLDIAALWMGVSPPDPDNFIETMEFVVNLEAFLRFKKADAMIAARKAGAA